MAICDPDITKPNYAQNKLKAQNELLVAISEAQALFISGHAPDRVYAQMLQILVRSTGSEYGFLDEVIRNPDGKKVERILDAFVKNPNCHPERSEGSLRKTKCIIIADS